MSFSGQDYPDAVDHPDEVPRTVPRSDDGNAVRLVQRYGDRIRRVSDMRSWWCWDGCRWRRDNDDAHVREAARVLARELPEDDDKAKSFKRNSLSATGISGAVRVAETDPRVTAWTAELDAHPLLLNTPAGVVDLRTGRISPHDPALLLTRITPGLVDLDGQHPRWTAFLKETFDGDDELVGYVQRLAGMALIGEVREHVLPFLHGVGANGKGVFLLVLQGILGSVDTDGYAASAPDAFLMAGRDGVHPTEIARLRGCRLLVASEQTSGRRFDEAKVKKLTGGDMLTGRFMRGDFFDFRPSHLILVASNHLPAVKEGGPAFWRRVHMVPFRHVVPPERRDPELHTRLREAEGPAILGWAVRGAMAVIAGGLTAPTGVEAATEEYRVSEDSLASFVRDECLLGDAHWCAVEDFRSRYERHCTEIGVEPVSFRALTMRLMSEYPVTSARLSRPARRIYRGIGLLSDAEDPAGGDDG